MSVIANLAVGMTLKMDQLETSLKKAEGKISQLKRRMGQQSKSAGGNVNALSGAYNRLGNSIGNAVKRVGAFLIASAGIGALISGVRFAMQLEMVETQFSTLMGSTSAAQDAIGKLRDFAANTPFQLQGILEATRTLLAFGMSQEEMMPTMRMLGNVAAGSGMNLKSLSVIFGQIRAAGRLMTQDMNQLLNAGIPILDVLGEKYGMNGEAVRKMAEQGKISFADVQEALSSTQEVGGIYFQATQKMSETLTGKLSTLKDKFADLTAEVGQKLMPHLAKLIEKLGEAVQWVKDLDSRTVNMVVTFGKYVAVTVATVGAIMMVRKAVAVLRAVYQAMIVTKIFFLSLTPKGWAILAIGAVVAAGALMVYNNQADKNNKKLAQTTEQLDKQEEAQKKVNEAQRKTLEQMKAEEDAAKAKQKALDDLVKKGESLTESMRTPMEVFNDRIGELRNMVDKGVISWETYGRAVKAAMKTLATSNKKKEQKDSPVGAVTRGSVAAFSAIQKANKEQQHQIKLDEKRNQQLAQLNAIMGGMDLTGDNVNVVNM